MTTTTGASRSKDRRRINQQARRRPGYRRNRTLLRALCRESGVLFVPNAPTARYVKWTPRVSGGGEPILAGFLGSVRRQVREAMAGRALVHKTRRTGNRD